MLTLSIITPSFNQGHFIERTIQSVLNQSVACYEYRVIDGGSQDETLTILKRYEHQLRFVSELDQGQADAVNKGLKEASGDIIGWINSDDIYYPDTFKKVLAIFAAHPKVDVIYGDAYHLDQGDQIIDKYPSESWNKTRLVKTCYLSQPTVFWRRHLLAQYGYLDEQLYYCLDYEYWLRLALAGAQFYYLPSILAGSRIHPQTKTASAPLQAYIETLTMLRQKMGYVAAEWLIGYAVAKVKTRTALRFPQYRFIIAVISIAMCAALRWNGLFRGTMTCFYLPIKAVLLKIEVGWAKRSVPTI